MPLLKSSEPLPERPVIIGYYGEPGVRKTSIAHTAETPLLIDFDRGVARSWGRKDAIIVNSWEDILTEEQAGTFKNYKTIVIDTAKAALDDFLMTYVVKQDFKLQKNKLQAYGAIGDAFKLFLNNRRNEGSDVIIIAHAKKDEDTKKMIPDVTGQSYNLMLRVSDQIGFVSTKNNQASVQWYPTDVTVGKNTANLPDTIIPDKSAPEFKNFMAEIITKVKKSIVEMSEAQKEALDKSEKYQKEIAAVKEVDDINMLITPIQALPKHLKDPLNMLLRDKAGEKKFVFNKQSKQFEAPKKEEPKPELVKQPEAEEVDLS